MKCYVRSITEKSFVIFYESYCEEFLRFDECGRCTLFAQFEHGARNRNRIYEYDFINFYHNSLKNTIFMTDINDNINVLVKIILDYLFIIINNNRLK